MKPVHIVIDGIDYMLVRPFADVNHKYTVQRVAYAVRPDEQPTDGWQPCYELVCDLVAPCKWGEPKVYYIGHEYNPVDDRII